MNSLCRGMVKTEECDIQTDLIKIYTGYVSELQHIFVSPLQQLAWVARTHVETMLNIARSRW